MNVRKIAHLLLVTIFVVATGRVQAQKYAVSEIPPELLTNANAVIRIEEASYTITDILHAKYKSKLVLTILNNGAKNQTNQAVWYDVQSKITSISGKIYDAQGILVKTLKKDEIHDIAYSSFSIFDDNRYKWVDLSFKSLPYTIEFEYEKEYMNLFYASNWYTLPDDNISVVHSKYTISAPSDLHPSYKILNTSEAPSVVEQLGIKTTTFEYKNLAVKESEVYGPAVYKSSPMVLVSPSKFDFDGYKGGFSSWKQFNDWMLELIKDRVELTPEVIAQVQSLTAGMSTEEKIRAVYNYLQQNTRYVSIQLGIGGFQPFPAMTVKEKGYGDCKALSNYTYAMLKALDITSHHVLVDAGNRPRPILKDFPNSTFNHMILCVPNNGDTLWLECTSQTNPFGYQGKFTGDRDVFLITEDGGKIVHTTVYKKEDNIQSRKAQVTLDAEGNGTANVATTFQGIQYENDGLYHYFNQSPDEQKKWILENTDIPSYDLVNFNFSIVKDKIPSINQSLEVRLKNYAQSSADRLFIPLNLMNRYSYVPERNANRQSDINYPHAFVDIDTVVYQIPETLHPEFMPEPIQFSSDFGEYEVNVTLDQGKVVYVRKFSMNKGVYPKASYDQFRDFFKEVKKADNLKIVFLKNT